MSDAISSAAGEIGTTPWGAGCRPCHVATLTNVPARTVHPQAMMRLGAYFAVWQHREQGAGSICRKSAPDTRNRRASIMEGQAQQPPPLSYLLNARVAIAYPAALNIAGRVGEVVAVDDYEEPSAMTATVRLDDDGTGGGMAQVAVSHLTVLCHARNASYAVLTPQLGFNSPGVCRRISHDGSLALARHATITSLGSPARLGTPETLGFRPVRRKRSRLAGDDDDDDDELQQLYHMTQRRRQYPRDSLLGKLSSSDDEVDIMDAHRPAAPSTVLPGVCAAGLGNGTQQRHQRPMAVVAPATAPTAIRAPAQLSPADAVPRAAGDGVGAAAAAVASALGGSGAARRPRRLASLAAVSDADGTPPSGGASSSRSGESSSD